MAFLPSGVQESNLVRDGKGWETLSSEIQLSTPHLTIASDEVKTPTRVRPRKWTVAHRKAAVVIAPMTETGSFVLILQERIPIRRTIWEMPAGQIDDSSAPDENTIRAVALRELQEETGYELAPEGELISLGYYFSSPGFTDEHGYFFLARPVRISQSGHHHDAGETILSCREFNQDALKEMIAGNEIRDANTLSIWARLVARGEIRG